nr:DUF4198 domain-containing protein [Herbaspirillum sp. ASV7]
MNSKCFSIALAFAGIVATATAHAHGVWVAQRTGEWALVLGENGVDDAYRPEAVKKLIALAADGTESAIRIRPQQRNVVVEPAAGAKAIAASFEDGYWSQDANGKWRSGPKSAVAGARHGGFYQMYTQTILAPGYKPTAATLSATDFPLQIIALDDPLALKKGKTLRVQVLFRGEPMAGVQLATDYTGDTKVRSAKTDRQGQVAFRIHNAGLNVIKVAHTVRRVDRTEADEDGYAATLAFTFPHED